MIAPPHKPTLRRLCAKHGIISALTLWQQSGIAPLVAWDVLSGNAISEQIASQVLGALNAIRGTQYTLADVDVRLVETQKERGG